jgi:hypothetical protein
MSDTNLAIHEIWYYAKHPTWGRAGGRAYTYRWKTAQEAQGWIDEYGPGSDGKQYQIEMCVLFPPKTQCEEEQTESSESSESEWPITPRMRVKCINDLFHPNGPASHIGQLGTVYPSAKLADSILWYVRFDSEEVWDQCSEKYIREMFLPEDKNNG